MTVASKEAGVIANVLVALSHLVGGKESESERNRNRKRKMCARVVMLMHVCVWVCVSSARVWGCEGVRV